MRKNIKLSLLVSGLLLLSGCGSNNTTTEKTFEAVATEQSLQTLHAIDENVTNHAPVATSKTYCAIENVTLEGAQLCATDEDNDTIIYRLSDLNSSKGEIDLNTTTGMFSYTPAENFVGTYEFSFIAIDEHYTQSEETTATIIVKEQDNQQEVPTAPENLEANATSSTSIELTWEDTSDNESSFVIYQDGVAIKSVDANTQSITIEGLVEGETYSFYVRSKNDAGCSTLSNEATATTLTTQSAPNAPENLKVIVKNETCLRLQWDDKSDNESGFKIYITSDGSETLVKTVAANCTCTTLSGLMPDTQYTMRVEAFNNSGEAISDELTASTDAHVNHIPVAYTKTFSTYNYTNLSGELCACDADGDRLTFDANVSDLNGTLDLNSTSGKFVYIPTSGFIGLDSFSYTVKDETNTSNEEKVFIHVYE